VSAFSLDDEQSNPWAAQLLGKVPSCRVNTDEAFYRFADFRVRTDQRTIAFPGNLLLSDNFFRPRWAGLGDRRLKNVGLVLEWVPEANKDQIRRDFATLVKQYTTGCRRAGGCTTSDCASNPAFTAVAPKAAVVKALQAIKDASATEVNIRTCPHMPATAAGPEPADKKEKKLDRFFAAVSLAEGETIRRIVHSQHSVLKKAGVALRDCEGNLLDRSRLFFVDSDAKTAAAGAVSPTTPAPPTPTPTPSSPTDIVATAPIAVQCLRYFNCEMYYTNPELDWLMDGLQLVPVQDRISFFTECLRLRKRERNIWIDTPLAKVFTAREEWHMLQSRALIYQVNSAIRSKRNLDVRGVFARFDQDGDGSLSCEELQRALDSMKLGFAPRDITDITRLADQSNTGKVALTDFVKIFNIPEFVFKPKSAKPAEELANMTWTCQGCTFVNSVFESTCAVCEMGWTGKREVPPGKWMCSGELGGCTFFNPNNQFYCEICNRARPDLASVRF